MKTESGKPNDDSVMKTQGYKKQLGEEICGFKGYFLHLICKTKLSIELPPITPLSEVCQQCL